MLKLEKAGALWSEVTTPDGRTGYIRSSSIAEIIPEQENLSTGEDLAQGIIASARWMMGIPYLWGGNSAKANDCSGYTQTVYRANGINLPRDSRQQALLGDLVEPDSAFSNVRPGDLLFFGSKERVTHVGISLGGAEFIHQGGLVAVNSLNPTAPNYSPYRHKSLKYIKRIF
jgi:cell wall-associated NlpC family hydrolase